MDRIAFVAKMHSGKTTCSNELVNAYGYRRLSFADPVKEASVDMINAFLTYIGQEPSMTRAQLDRDKSDLRWLLQGVGTELGRQYVGPDSLWIDLFRKALRVDRTVCSLDGKSHLAVCDDCRFPNEIEALREMGFTIIRVVRDEQARINSIRESLRPVVDSRIIRAYEDAERETDPCLREEALDYADSLDSHTLVDAELEKILSHPSETFVDELEADFSIANIEGDFDAVRDVLRHVAIAEGSLV
jgi:hypothetical protein